MATEMLMVFAYDITSNKTRRRAAAILEEGASRVQKSVYEVRMSRPQAERLAARVAAILGPRDSLRVWAVGAAALGWSRVYGNAAPFEPQGGYWLM